MIWAVGCVCTDDIESCMKKVQGVKFAEEVCYNGTLIIKALSSGLDIGACNWLINGPNGSLRFLIPPICRSD
jgi:integrator complex subunit 9